MIREEGRRTRPDDRAPGAKRSQRRLEAVGYPTNAGVACRSTGTGTGTGTFGREGVVIWSTARS